MQNSTTKVINLLITRPFGEEPVKVEKLEVFIEGVKHDRHFGIKKLSGVREAKIASRGTEIINLRTITLVSVEELRKIATKLEVESVTGEDLEANITLEGYENITALPIGTILKFPKGCILYATGENFPCVVAGGRVAKRLGDKDLTWKFPKQAMNIRGITAMVYAAGFIKIGDEVEIIFPGNFEA